MTNFQFIVPSPPTASGLLAEYDVLEASLGSFRDILDASDWMRHADSPRGRLQRVLDGIEEPLPRDCKEALLNALLEHQNAVLRSAIHKERRVTELLEEEVVLDPDGGMRRFVGSVEVTIELDERAWERGFREAITRHIPDDLDPEAVTESIWRGMSAVREHGSALGWGILMGVVASLEAFLSQAARKVIEANPQYLRGLDATFSSVDVLDAGGIHELRQRLEGDAIARLGRTGFSGYARFFRSFLGEAGDITSLREIVERRNVLVHHDGRVSRQYLDAVGDRRDKLVIGDRLDVRLAYLKAAILEVQRIAWEMARAFSAPASEVLG